MGTSTKCSNSLYHTWELSLPHTDPLYHHGDVCTPTDPASNHTNSLYHHGNKHKSFKSPLPHMEIITTHTDPLTTMGICTTVEPNIQPHKLLITTYPGIHIAAR